jgi:hypothetical protein
MIYRYFALEIFYIMGRSSTVALACPHLFNVHLSREITASLRAAGGESECCRVLVSC